MNPIAVTVFGLLLVAWLGVLVVMLFRKDGKLPTPTNNVDVLLPLGTAIFIWMWIFGLVVFSN